MDFYSPPQWPSAQNIARILSLMSWEAVTRPSPCWCASCCPEGNTAGALTRPIMNSLFEVANILLGFQQSAQLLQSSPPWFKVGPQTLAGGWEGKLCHHPGYPTHPGPTCTSGTAYIRLNVHACASPVHTSPAVG